MNEALYERLLLLPRENLVNLMWEALDAMQASNTRSRTFCIMTAIGAKEKNPGSGDGTWIMPTGRAIKETTRVMGL